jgi:hypothetical protein
VRLNWRTKCALSVRITGNVCAHLAGFVVGKGTKPKKIGGRAGVRLAVSITPAVLSPGLPFLIGAI